jgi:hypothetical protein
LGNGGAMGVGRAGAATVAGLIGILQDH